MTKEKVFASFQMPGSVRFTGDGTVEEQTGEYFVNVCICVYLYLCLFFRCINRMQLVFCVMRLCLCVFVTVFCTRFVDCKVVPTSGFVYYCILYSSVHIPFVCCFILYVLVQVFIVLQLLLVFSFSSAFLCFSLQQCLCLFATSSEPQITADTPFFSRKIQVI